MRGAGRQGRAHRECVEGTTGGGKSGKKRRGGNRRKGGGRYWAEGWRAYAAGQQKRSSNRGECTGRGRVRDEVQKERKIRKENCREIREVGVLEWIWE